MIFRKPYAFLIKNFQKINFILFLLAAYIIFKNLAFSDLVANYISTGYYNPVLNPMSTYASFWFYLSVFLIVFICGALIYLLYYKQKPVIVYGLIILEYIAVAVIFGYSAGCFEQAGFAVMDTQTAYLLRDFLFIVSIPQYAVLVILLIRFLGLDLKRFGFREDAEFMEINEEDREEVEVGLEFDVHHVKRSIHNRFRRIKYVVLEHKLIFTTLTIVLSVLAIRYGYQQIFVENKTYTMGETLRSNTYEAVVRKMYFTGKDYAGNLINQEGRKYIILSVDVKNITSSPITIDVNKFVIIANHRYYVPILTHDQYFTDLGKVYHNQALEPNVTNTLLLIYEIKPDDFGSDYTLYYQEVRSANNLKLRLIHTEMTDLSQYEELETAYPNDLLSISFYDQSNIDLSLFNYQLSDETTYLYTSCYVWDCRVYEGRIASSNYTGNRMILRLNYRGDDSGLKLSNFLVKQAKLIYTKDGVEKSVRLTTPLSREWRGKYVYLLVPQEVKEATDVALEFVVRDKAYRYYLKGGDTSETG